MVFDFLQFSRIKANLGQFVVKMYKPTHGKRDVIAYANNKNSDEPVHESSLAIIYYRYQTWFFMH